MSSSSVYSKPTAGFDSSAITQRCFYLGWNIGVPACHISSEDCCSKIALVSVAVLVISLGVLQCSFHDALFTFVNLLFHSSLSFSLSLSPSMESALLLPLFPFFSSRVCSSSSFCSSFHCGSIIFPLSRLVSFLHHASLSLFFANVLPIPPVSPSQLPAVPPHISPLPPSRAKCFISRSSSMSVCQSLGFVCYTKTISPGTFLQSALASLG